MGMNSKILEIRFFADVLQINSIFTGTWNRKGINVMRMTIRVMTMSREMSGVIEGSLCDIAWSVVECIAISGCGFRVISTCVQPSG